MLINHIAEKNQGHRSIKNNTIGTGPTLMFLIIYKPYI